MVNKTNLEIFNVVNKYFTLSGNRMLVERLPDAEVKTKGGLFIGESSKAYSDIKTHKPMVCLVLAVGEGYNSDDSTETKIPTDVQPGHVVVINALGVSFFSTFPGIPSYTDMKFGISSESDIQMRFDSMELFEAYTKEISDLLAVSNG